MEKFSWKKRAASFGYAWKGIRMLVTQEHNAWIHLTAAVCVTAAGWGFGISRTEWMIVTGCMGCVLAAEAFNTAIERLVDLVSPQRQPLAGQVKDLAAGAVLITALAAACIGLLVFLPYLRALTV